MFCDSWKMVVQLFFFSMALYGCVQVNPWKWQSSFEFCSTSAADFVCLWEGNGQKVENPDLAAAPLGKGEMFRTKGIVKWSGMCWGAAGTRMSELQALFQEGLQLMAFTYLNNLLGLGSSHTRLVLFPILSVLQKMLLPLRSAMALTVQQRAGSL